MDDYSDNDNTYICINCGAAFQGGEGVCPHCGAGYAQPAYPREQQYYPAYSQDQYYPQDQQYDQDQYYPQDQQYYQDQYYQQDQQYYQDQYHQQDQYYAQEQYYQAQQDGHPPVKKRRGKKTATILIVILVILIGAATAGYFYLRSALSTAPEVLGDDRSDAKYTFLILGADYGEYNTDVIMVATFDTADHTLDIVSIPRDTLVNVSWNLKKANSILANMRASHSGEGDDRALRATVEMFADLLGFEVDFWVLVNIQAFVSLVDAIDGVDYYVPVNMNYDDRAGGLSIHYTQGEHHLTGQQALEVLRFRAGYSNADIGRIGTQQGFLESAAAQILEKRDSLNIASLAGIFLSNVKTDLKLDELIWFGRAFMELDAENINFHMMPGDAGATIRSQSYVTIYVDEWLELVNSVLNPYDYDITADDVSILTRDADRRLYVTDGNRRGDASWGT